MKMFDLGAYKDSMHEEGWVEILDHRDNPTGVKIKVAGPDTDVFRKAELRLKNKSLKQVQRSKGRGDLKAEDSDKNGLEFLIDITLGWENVVFHGTEMPFTTENADMLYTAVPFVRDQVDRFVADRSNFFD